MDAPAQAQPAAPEPPSEPDLRERARLKVVEAGQLYQAGDHPRALEQLEEAYRLYPSAKLFFNFGVAYRKLNRETDAFVAFRRFLKEAPDAEADRRTQAAHNLEELRARLVLLDVEADTSGAEILVDGRALGKTPIDEPLALTPGAHEIVVQKIGVALPFRDRVSGVAGERIRVRARLSSASTPSHTAPALPPAAAIVSESRPSEAATTSRPRWWLWAGVGVLAAGATTVAIVLGSRREPGLVCIDCNAGVHRLP